MPMRRRCGGNPWIGRSPCRISPASGRSRPASMRSNVVLPHPEGPRNVTNSPGSTCRLKSRTASTLRPPGIAYALPTPRMTRDLAEDLSIRRAPAGPASRDRTAAAAVNRRKHEGNEDHAQCRGFADVTAIHLREDRRGHQRPVRRHDEDHGGQVVTLRVNVKIMPAVTAGRTRGSSTRRNVCACVAPIHIDASSSERWSWPNARTPERTA